jgi:hypothetical protein
MGDIEDDSAGTPLIAIFDSARKFGLTDAEVLAAVDGCVYEIGTDASVAELMDELTAALAREIVAKQQRALSEQPAPAPEQRRARSRDPR